MYISLLIIHQLVFHVLRCLLLFFQEVQRITCSPRASSPNRPPRPASSAKDGPNSFSAKPLVSLFEYFVVVLFCMDDGVPLISLIRKRQRSACGSHLSKVMVILSMKEWEEILLFYVMDVDRITTEPCFWCRSSFMRSSLARVQLH